VHLKEWNIRLIVRIWHHVTSFSLGRQQNLSGQRLDNLDKFSITVETFLDGISMDVLQTVFQEWIR
jgi:hypothetical protein